MEAVTSCNDDLLLAKLRPLARRGAYVHCGGDVLEIRTLTKGGNQSIQALPRSDFLAAVECGLLRQIAPDRHALSRTGAAALRRRLSTPADTTAERPADIVKDAVSLPRINVAESPLSWLRQHKDGNGRPLLTDAEFDAGERLRADFERAHLQPRVTSAWSAVANDSRARRAAPGLAMAMSDNAVAARQQVEAALVAVGPEHAGVLVDVCCLLQGIELTERNKGWPRRSGKVVLQHALAALARHYGLAPAVRAAAITRVRHWGAADYRPSIDAGKAPRA